MGRTTLDYSLIYLIVQIYRSSRVSEIDFQNKCIYWVSSIQVGVSLILEMEYCSKSLYAIELIKARLTSIDMLTYNSETS